MALAPGTRLGAYEIVSLLGSGGMGEVYRARDTKLGRDVALKILPDAFTNEPERLARFRREAQVLASLNHPHIGAIYGLEESGAQQFLVLELIDGESLDRRIARGKIPVDEALAIAKQIAEALEAAHEKGIIHRDLKPANIALTSGGNVKVLDFGLAKAMEPANGAPIDLANSPTITSPAMMTGVGMILGTAAYMSPEQAKGKPADKRCDVWAFGCVLYEMLSGKRAFSGEGVSDTLAAVLRGEPTWSALPGDLPSNACTVLRRCLQKDSGKRLRDIGDARLELDDVPSDGPAPIPSRAREYVGWGAAVLLLVPLAILWWRGTTPQTLPHVRTAIVLPSDQKLATGGAAYPLALSPDGARLAYVAEQEGRTQLYLRELNALEPKAVPGTAGATQPFFSPNGQWIGFFASGALQKVAVAGGVPLRICNVSGASAGGSWGGNNTIIVAIRGSHLWKTSADGGALEALAASGPAAWPEILPDDKTVLFTTGIGGNNSAFATMALDGSAKRIVARTTDSPLDGPAVLGAGAGLAQARWVSSGFLAYGGAPGIVRAVPFDLGSLSVKGSPLPIVDSVERGRNSGGVYFAVSRSGLLIYAPTGERHQLVWVDRAGMTTPISADREAFRGPQVSPDGRRIVVAINDETRRSDIWVYDAERGTKSRLTNEGHNLKPVWSPDGTRITFNGTGIAEMPSGGGQRATLLSIDDVKSRLPAGTNAYPTSWSPDEKYLLFQADEADLFVLSRGSTNPKPLIARSSNDFFGKFSPDGRWVSYTSDESGRFEVYVARFPDLVDKVAISSDGGREAIWSRDGRELFYRAGDAVMAVTVDFSRTARVEKPRRLFSGSYSGAGREAAFDVSPDGRRFVMVKSDEVSTLRSLVVMQNWSEELKARVPTK
jgi:eukaryotic-like serine/threonine-protein kinase